MDRHALLTRFSLSPWFGAIPVADRKEVLRACELRQYRRGELIFRQGDSATAKHAAFFGLARGSVKLSTLREDGKEAVLFTLEAGDWFGELSLIDGQPRTHDATALEAAEVLLVPKREFDDLMMRPAFARAMFDMLARRTRALYGMLDDATLRSARARVVRRLLRLAHGDGQQAPFSRDIVPVSQDALAMMLGMTRQTLYKELKLLVDEGVINLHYGRIEIVSAVRLEGVAYQL